MSACDMGADKAMSEKASKLTAIVEYEFWKIFTRFNRIKNVRNF